MQYKKISQAFSKLSPSFLPAFSKLSPISPSFLQAFSKLLFRLSSVFLEKAWRFFEIHGDFGCVETPYILRECICFLRGYFWSVCPSVCNPSVIFRNFWRFCSKIVGMLGESLEKAWRKLGESLRGRLGDTTPVAYVQVYGETD